MDDLALRELNAEENVDYVWRAEPADPRVRAPQGQIEKIEIDREWEPSRAGLQVEESRSPNVQGSKSLRKRMLNIQFSMSKAQ
jgi:hypothetical protein